MYPDAFRTELCDSLTTFYEHPQESRCCVAKALPPRLRTCPTDDAATDSAEEENPEAPTPSPPPVAVAEAAAVPPNTA